MQEHDERRWAAALCTTTLMMLADPVAVSPDGLDMIQQARAWLGQVDAGSQGASGYWPPLWPALLLPAVLFGLEQNWGFLLNLLLAGATAWPLHALTWRLSGRQGARIAVVLYTLMPAVREHAVVLDARPLGWFLATATLLAVVQASAGTRRWRTAWFLATLGTLARPEGILLPLLVGAAAWHNSIPGRHLAGCLVAALVPRVALVPGSRSGWEAFYAPWYLSWSKVDLTALYGSTTAASPYRRFVLDVAERGLEAHPKDDPFVALMGGLALVMKAPTALNDAAIGLGHVFGVLLGCTTLLGIAVLAFHGRGTRLALVGVGLVGIAIVLAPMAQGQPTPEANLLCLVPALLAATSLGIEDGSRRLARRLRTLSRKSMSVRRAPIMAVLLVGALLEVHLGPTRGSPPAFFEGSLSARLATTRLLDRPPASGVIASRIPARHVVLQAGLRHTPLPSPWERWSPEPGTGVLLSSVDILGEDGGRTLELLEDPDWQIHWVAHEQGLLHWDQALQDGAFPYAGDRWWLAYLEPRLTAGPAPLH
ncbi:MAG: hypothetical protein QGG40_01060 [Myxococcota bacterium]|nr:hypothetical protein [Myxococcota bacterium]